jgi:hypothetical protein
MSALAGCNRAPVAGTPELTIPPASSAGTAREPDAAAPPPVSSAREQAPPKIECEAIDQPSNYGAFVPGKTEIQAVLRSLDGICANAPVEQGAVRDCIARHATPFVSVTFPLPTPAPDDALVHDCSIWLKTAEIPGRRWIVVDALLLKKDTNLKQDVPVRRRTVHEVQNGTLRRFFATEDWGGPQMALCQAPPAVTKGIIPGERSLPRKLVSFFLCDLWG